MVAPTGVLAGVSFRFAREVLERANVIARAVFVYGKGASSIGAAIGRFRMRNVGEKENGSR